MFFFPVLEALDLLARFLQRGVTVRQSAIHTSCVEFLSLNLWVD